MKCEKCNCDDLRPSGDYFSRFLWCSKCGHQTFFKDWQYIRDNNKYVKEYFDGLDRSAAKRPVGKFPSIRLSRGLDDLEFDYDKAIIDGEYTSEED